MKNNLPIVQWNKKAGRRFPDMTSDGVANILSEAILDSGLEAPLSTEVSESVATSLYHLFNSCIEHSLMSARIWADLSRKQRQARLHGLVLGDSSIGHLHNLVIDGGLVLPPNFTIDMFGLKKNSFTSDASAKLELEILFLSTENSNLLEKEQLKPGYRKPGRPRSAKDTQSLTFQLHKSTVKDDKKKPVYTLSIKGSGLFLLQGHTDYALPTRLVDLDDSEEAATPTELQLFVQALRSPFNLLGSLVKAAIKTKIVSYSMVPSTRAILPFLNDLTNEDIRVKGFTFTRYIDFSDFGTDAKAAVTVRQEFLKSLFLIYNAAKGNKRDYTNNGMETYKGVTCETRFEDETKQSVFDISYMSQDGPPVEEDSGTKFFRKPAHNISDIHSVRIFRVLKERNRLSTHAMTSMQFSVPKTADRGKLNLDSRGANYLRDHCLRVRFTVFNKYLRDNMCVSHLDGLLRYLCPDGQLKTFRTNLNKLFHRVLDGYDYFYWSGLEWAPVASVKGRRAFLDNVRMSGTPHKLNRLINIWASREAATSPEMHDLMNLTMAIYYPEDWDKLRNGHALLSTRLREIHRKTKRVHAVALSVFGVDLRYPLAFHVTVFDAFCNSSLHALDSLADLLDDKARSRIKARIKKDPKLTSQALRNLSRPNAWRALPLTMRRRETEFVL